MKTSAKYLKIVEWSEEDQLFIGQCPGIIGPCCHGDDEAEVYKELCTIVDEWIKVYQKDGMPLPAATAGKEYSGKFVIRVGKALHKALAIDAMRYDESMNSHCVHLLRENSASYGTK